MNALKRMLRKWIRPRVVVLHDGQPLAWEIEDAQVAAEFWLSDAGMKLKLIVEDRIGHAILDGFSEDRVRGMSEMFGFCFTRQAFQEMDQEEPPGVKETTIQFAENTVDELKDVSKEKGHSVA